MKQRKLTNKQIAVLSAIVHDCDPDRNETGTAWTLEWRGLVRFDRSISKTATGWYATDAGKAALQAYRDERDAAARERHQKAQQPKARTFPFQIYIREPGDTYWKKYLNPLATEVKARRRALLMMQQLPRRDYRITNRGVTIWQSNLLSPEWSS